eukprot:gene7536-8373_t
MLKPGDSVVPPKSPKTGRKGPKSPRPKSVNKKQQGRPAGGSRNGTHGKSSDSPSSKKNLDMNLVQSKPHGSYDGLLSDGKEVTPLGVQDEEKQEEGSKHKQQQKASRNKFSHRMYDNSGEIYSYLKGEIASSSLPSITDEYQKRRAYSVAFSTKRYEEVLKDVLLDSNFFSAYSTFEAKHKNKVMVMLMDFFDHNFRFSDSKRVIIAKDTEDPIDVIEEIQQAIVAHVIHVCAAFARCRIKECALCLEDLLSEDAKEAGKHTHQQPLYARVNTMKASTDNVINMLVDEGFSLAENADLMELNGKMFRRDPHFDDMLAFSKDCKDDVYSHNITMDLWLYPQDKSKYVTVEVMKSLLVEMAAQKDKANSLIPGEMKSFMTDGDDVILTNPDSASLSTHLAAFINPERRLFICGCHTRSGQELGQKMIASGVKNFELIEDNFINIAHNDERFKKVRIIMCNVPCSKSGVVNPVDFVLQEGNTVAAKLLSSKLDAAKHKTIISDECMILRHALKFTHVQSVLYFTSSDSAVENDELVMKILKEHREEATSKSPFQLAHFLPDLVASLRKQIQSDQQHNKASTKNPVQLDSSDKYLKLKPSSFMNGCFIALLKRQFIEPTAKEVLERASKKGLVSKGRTRKLTTQAASHKHARENTMTKEEKEKPIKHEPKADDDDDETNATPFHKFF